MAICLNKLIIHDYLPLGMKELAIEVRHCGCIRGPSSFRMPSIKVLEPIWKLQESLAAFKGIQQAT